MQAHCCIVCYVSMVGYLNRLPRAVVSAHYCERIYIRMLLMFSLRVRISISISISIRKARLRTARRRGGH